MGQGRTLSQEQATDTDHQQSHSKPLEKKKKSLTRILSTSSRSSKKSPRSRPPSTEDLHTPTTPQIPVPVWPLTSESSPRIPSMSFDLFMSQVTDQGYAELDGSRAQQSPGTDTPHSRKPERPTIRTKGILRNFSEPISRESSELDENISIPLAGEAMNLPAERYPTPHTATFPLIPTKAKTGLRMPAAFSSVPRGRGASVTSPVPTHSPNLIQQRPSTAGGEAKSRPTGKRRPVGKMDGAFPFSIFDDLPKIPQRPWQADYSNNEVRSSFRSALTTTSSHIETTSTERSSIVTKGTSIAESTADVQSRPGSKSGGMTVDDAIDMYAAGFADDDEPGTTESRDTSISEEDRRRSLRIAEAINDSIGGLITPSRPVTGDPNNRHDMKSGDSISNSVALPPAISPATSSRDQYGFLKANHHINVQQYDAWNATYAPDQERRTGRWNTYMRDQGLPTNEPNLFPNRSAKTERFIRKGIPPAWRGSAWFFYAGGHAYLKRHAGLYSYLVTRSEVKLPESDKEAIERDLHRTFPDNIHFKPDAQRLDAPSAESPILSSLRRVLRAFAFHCPRIGYCQSLNFLTGLLLLFLPEEKAFWMLHIITTVYLPSTHEVSLEGANVDLWVLMVALRSTMPTIWNKVGAAGTPADGLDSGARLPPISLCTTSWFMSLFIGTLPIESVLRVWDVLFYEGSRTLFRVALTIFKLGEQRIKGVGDSMELFQVVQGLPRGMLDASALMTTVCRRGGVSSEWIEARRWERREWYAKERTRTLVSVDEGVRTEYFAQRGGSQQKSDTEGPKRKDSLWKRKKHTKKKGGSGKKDSPRPDQDADESIPSPYQGISPEGRELLSI